MDELYGIIPADVDVTFLRQQEDMLQTNENISTALRSSCILGSMLKIYMFGERTALSSEQGNLLIKIMKSISEGCVISEIPMSYDVMKDKVEVIFTRIFEVHPVGICIPEAFSSSRDVVYEGHHVNVMTMLADMLLQIDIKDLHVKPFRIRDEEGTRVLREPSSGMDFKEMYEYTTRHYGPDVIPLPVTVALDELALNKVGSRGAKPLYIQISSIHADTYWAESNIRCIGFSPATLVSNCTLCH